MLVRLLRAFPLLLLLSAPLAFSQTTATLTGAVTDPSQAAVANVTVKVTNETTGVVSSSSTNADGLFVFQNLPIGRYDLAISHAGFKAYSATGIVLDPTAQVRQDVHLEVGQVQQSMNVEATQAAVQTSDGTVSSVITSEQINTAVLNGRNFAKLAMLMPGAVYQSSSDELYNAGLNAPGSPVSINGMNALTAGWFQDGAYNMNVGNGAAAQHIPALDSIQEMQVQTSNYSARYGTAGGAVINAVTRNGTSQFHGNAYEYLRNNDFDARNFFNPVVSPLKQNNFGFSIGGPVILPHYNHNRNTTFFFWNEDWRYRNSATTLRTATPDPNIRAGNFGPEAARLGKSITDPSTGAPFPNNTIPTNRIDPNAALLMQDYFPLPNNPGGGFQNYINNGVGKLDPRSDTIRVDHNFSDKYRAFFTLAHDNIQVINPYVQLLNADLFPTMYQQEATYSWTGAGNFTMVLSPRSTNEIQYSFKIFDVNLLLQDKSATAARPSGMNIQDFYPGANSFNLVPNITFGQGWGPIGTSVLPLSPATDDTRILSDNYSYVLGKHVLQAGGMWFHYTKNQAVNNQTQGSYSFSGIFTGDAMADFLLGEAATYSQSNARFIRDYKFDQTEWYLQDDWRATSRLTLNLGFRLYVIPLVTVEGNQMTSFLASAYSPAAAPQITSAGVLVPTANYNPLNGIVQAGKNGVPAGFAPTYIGWAPRFGFAYDPTGSGKTAIRGGYGISYLNAGNDDSALVLNPPYNVAVSLVNVPLSNPSQGTPKAASPVALNAFSPSFARPRIQSWSLMVQHEFPGQLLASIGYQGTRGSDFEVWIDQNSPAFIPPSGYQFNPAVNTNAVNVNTLRPYVGYGSITQFNSGLGSIYNALQLIMQRRFAKGFAIQANYTFGKNLGETQTQRNMLVQNPLNWRADYGPTNFDATHVFSMNYIWEIPFLKGRKTLLGEVFGNWQLAGTITAQSGLALSPGLSTPTAGLATRPNATGQSPAGPQTLQHWFNTAAFAAPPFGFFGNSGTGVIRGPGFWVWDSSVSRIFPLWEKTRLRLSGEFFNMLNHPNWSGVGTGLGGGTYGQITSARDPREIQLSLRIDF
ncbi:MAG TPA: carboxypeptidase-like regulatory domain-containing protein [Bryobacteraceae bacterium]|jgi:hypothetical protein